MAAKKSSKLSPGQVIKVKPDQTMPEFPELSIAGWTGMILETRGRGADLKYILQWDDETLANIQEEIKSEYESKQLAIEMACLPAVMVERTE